MSRVLLISHYIPYFPGPGAPTREYCLARELARKHELVYLLPFYGEEDRIKLEALSSFSQVELYTQVRPTKHGLLRRLNWSLERRIPFTATARKIVGPPQLVQQLQGIIPALHKALAEIRWQEFDIVQVAHSQLAFWLRHVPIPVPRVIDWHNINSAYYERLFQKKVSRGQEISNRIEQRRVVRYERDLANNFEHSLVVSETDAFHLRRLSPGAKISVVPNGVETSYFHNRVPGQVDSDMLVFTGTMDYEPNIEGMLFFVAQVLPLLWQQYPALKLSVVGRYPVPAITELAVKFPGRVIVTSEVDDVRPYLQEAVVVVVPLLNGGGTRLKILEAMAMNKAIVSTSVGVEGIDVVDDKSILLADTAPTFAKAVSSLIKAPQRRRQLAQNGYQLATSVYDWKPIAAKQDRAWQEATRYGEQSRGT